MEKFTKVAKYTISLVQFLQASKRSEIVLIGNLGRESIEVEKVTVAEEEESNKGGNGRRKGRKKVQRGEREGAKNESRRGRRK